MTKKDLCDLEVTLKWKKYYEEKGYIVALVDLTQNNSVNEIINLTHKLTKNVQDKREEKGLIKRDIKALVIGIPNVGKSTLINRIDFKCKLSYLGKNVDEKKAFLMLYDYSADKLLIENSDVIDFSYKTANKTIMSIVNVPNKRINKIYINKTNVK